MAKTARHTLAYTTGSVAATDRGTQRHQTDMRTTFTDAVVAAIIGTRHRIVADGTASSRENAVLSGRS